ncbi:MAG: ATP-grasp domain-containing protein [Candidatus Woesebacteria bacterium]|nr:ATP-grasp domain-containing protein [Candidatus Woesebacteria bacterium]
MKTNHKIVNFGMCFSRDFEGTTPLSHIGRKLPVYLRLLELCQAEGWEVYVLTRKTYEGRGYFNGAWLFINGKFEKVDAVVKIDLVFDWVGNLLFPPKQDEAPQPNGRGIFSQASSGVESLRSETSSLTHRGFKPGVFAKGDKGLKVVNSREFKELTCNKWETYLILRDYMPKTYWVGELKNAFNLVNQISTENIVLKPYDGLRGKGIFIGLKKDLKDFKPEKTDRKYISQEFVDTSKGIPNLTPGRHDLRIVVINGEVVWCHVRVPAQGSYLANAAHGGNLTEVDYSQVPESVKKVVKVISRRFYKDYDNPIFSLDFGIGLDGTPLIFEINDQIGFPRWEMKNRDNFLTALIRNFHEKI